ncbi:MAG: sulfotransferase [Desulfuromonadales bacterium]|jgi:hypothetical protein
MTSLSNMFVVCGLHRSGTTYVGEILHRCGVTIIHEPLNEHHGVEGVPVAYPHVEHSGDHFAPLLNKLFDLNARWNRSRLAQMNSGCSKWLYRLTGGRKGIHWGSIRLRRGLGCPPKLFCWKDPFASLATPYLVNAFNARILCLVRHPAAIHYSTEKQGWRFDIANLIDQPELIARYGQDIPSTHWAMAREYPAASIAILWKFMFRINSAFAERDERLLLQSHENLCLAPVSSARKICAHFGLDFSAPLESYVLEHASGTNTEASNGRLHDFRRDVKALPDAWRSRVSAADEKLIRDLVGDDVLSFYGTW